MRGCGRNNKAASGTERLRRGTARLRKSLAAEQLRRGTARLRRETMRLRASLRGTVWLRLGIARLCAKLSRCAQNCEIAREVARGTVRLCELQGRPEL
ncbi:hypothetical protein AXF42_Ash019880 [Apostasia shenzhenica]|uniref:Uncharacterized protein n=1 Tax=Apostasia shenzhenica TaxID=1088818 RepID=A0A2H9ZX40_9ASPA|nr:hypothetical protein AXF42_Ash019880 [Apostasia shenzhenica]